LTPRVLGLGVVSCFLFLEIFFIWRWLTPRQPRQLPTSSRDDRVTPSSSSPCSSR
jgi:hypothetical protein